ncbi:unnamed protein product [Amoebophrya sp. A25]|nr:unnamed protein product [Amoebophrya sp. A25]|eukprot:GSA25T00013600001.1
MATVSSRSQLWGPPSGLLGLSAPLLAPPAETLPNGAPPATFSEARPVWSVVNGNSGQEQGAPDTADSPFSTPSAFGGRAGTVGRGSSSQVWETVTRADVSTTLPPPASERDANNYLLYRVRDPEPATTSEMMMVALWKGFWMFVVSFLLVAVFYVAFAVVFLESEDLSQDAILDMGGKNSPSSNILGVTDENFGEPGRVGLRVP